MTTADKIGRMLPQARELAEHSRAKDEMDATRLGQPIEYSQETFKLVEEYNTLLRRYDTLRAGEEQCAE